MEPQKKVGGKPDNIGPADSAGGGGPAGGGDDQVPHHHVLDYCFVYVAKGRLLGSHHTGKPGLFDSINEDGDVTWFDIPSEIAPTDPGFAHGGKNGYDDKPMREYLVELK